MRKLFVAISAIVLFISCQKDITGEIDGVSNTSSCNRLTRIVQGTTGVNNGDTVFLIKYDTLNRVAMVIDSIYKDTFTASYDASSKALINVTAYDYNAFYTNNTAGKPVSAEWETSRTTLDYNFDTIPLKLTSYYNDNGSWKRFRYFMLTLDAKKNVQKLDAFTNTGVADGNVVLTYTDVLSPFTVLGLINSFNMLGMEDVLPISDILYQSPYLAKTILSSVNEEELSITYEFDSKKRPVKSVAVDKYIPTGQILNIYTRFYYYECK